MTMSDHVMEMSLFWLILTVFCVLAAVVSGILLLRVGGILRKETAHGTLGRACLVVGVILFLMEAVVVWFYLLPYARFLFPGTT